MGVDPLEAVDRGPTLEMVVLFFLLLLLFGGFRRGCACYSDWNRSRASPSYALGARSVAALIFWPSPHLLEAVGR